MSSTGWKIYARDKDYRRVAEIDQFKSLEGIAKFNDVGPFQLTMDRRHPVVALLLQPGYGIHVYHEESGETLLSGPILGRDHKEDAETNQITLSGKDDNVFIASRVAHPSPTEQLPPYDVASHHEVSGVCSTVLRTYVNMNLGPGAIAVRRHPGLTLGTDPVVGTNVSGKLRWTPLLEELQKLALAGGDIGFRVVQVGEGLEFQTYQPVDRTGTVKFSREFGNLEGYEFEHDAPETNYVYVGSQGDLTARNIKEGQDSASVSTWWRLEEFADRRDVDNADENKEEILQQKIDEVLLEKGEKATLELFPIDTAGVSYGVDYKLGDKVTIVVAGPELFPNFEGILLQEVIREVKVRLEPESTTVVPTVGDPKPADVIRVLTQLKRHAYRLSNLESI